MAEETKRREAVEQQVAENATRRTELEAALGEIQLVQEAFQQELETADNPKQLLELESSLAASQQAREALEGELEFMFTASQRPGAIIKRYIIRTT